MTRRRPIYSARPIKRVQVKGRKTEFMVYELLALRTSDDSGPEGPQPGWGS